MLANERIKELEQESLKLKRSEKSKTSHDHKRTSTEYSYRDKQKHIRHSVESEGTSMPDHKLKQSTASSSSNTSIKSPSFVKKENFQSKIKTLGLSDSNGSSDETPENQKAVKAIGAEYPINELLRSITHEFAEEKHQCTPR